MFKTYHEWAAHYNTDLPSKLTWKSVRVGDETTHEATTPYFDVGELLKQSPKEVHSLVFPPAKQPARPSAKPPPKLQRNMVLSASAKHKLNAKLQSHIKRAKRE